MKRIITLAIALLIGTIGVQAQSLYGDMENWHSLSVGSTTLYNPQGWYSADSLTFTAGPFLYPGAHFTRELFQTTDAHGGNSAALLISQQQDSIGVAPAILVNSQPKVDVATIDPSNPFSSIYFDGGTAVTQRMGEVSAWIKYMPTSSGDYGEMAAYAVVTDVKGQDSVIGGFDTLLTSISSYTKISGSITYYDATTVPERIVIEFSSSALGGSPSDSSMMYVDDVNMSTLGVPTVNGQQNAVACYPNPSNGMLHLNGPQNKQLLWQVYNVTGQLVGHQQINGNTTADLTYLSSGVYYYKVTDDIGTVVQRGKLTIAK